MKLDWQHVALLALALAGAGVCLFRPEFSKYVTPILSAVVPLALAKSSPLPQQQAALAAANKRPDVVVLNTGDTPAEVHVSDDGALKVRWPEGKRD